MFRALAELESVRNFNEVALSPAKQVIFLNRADGNLGHRAFSWTDLVRAYFLPGPLSPCPGSQHLQGAARSRSLTVFCPKTLFFRRKVKKWKNFSLEKLFDKTLFLFFLIRYLCVLLSANQLATPCRWWNSFAAINCPKIAKRSLSSTNYNYFINEPNLSLCQRAISPSYAKSWAFVEWSLVKASSCSKSMASLNQDETDKRRFKPSLDPIVNQC